MSDNIIKNMKLWTKEEVDKLKRLYKDNSLIELSDIFSRSLQSVYKKSRRIGLKKTLHDHSKRISQSLSLAYKIGRRKLPIGKDHPKWNGGKHLRQDGYYDIWSPNHPNKKGNNRVLAHRLIMEKHIGRYLLKSEVVHHKNGIKTDNRIENLLIMTQSEHAKLHKNEKSRNVL